MDRIFLYAVSYDEIMCRRAIKTFFAQAAEPQRISFGICLHTDAGENAAFVPQGIDPASLRIQRFPTLPRQAGGWSRMHAQALKAHEEYVWSVDLRAVCVEGWDAKLLAEFAACGSPRCVLTGAPTGGTAGEQPKRGSAVYLGNLFSRAASLIDVPSDPAIDGEEEAVALAARFYTHGYDLFENAETILTYPTDMEFPEAPWHVREASLRRIAALKPADQYGLGSVRSLDGGTSVETPIVTFPEAVLNQKKPVFQPLDQPSYTRSALAQDAPPGILILRDYLDASACRTLCDYANSQSSVPLSVGTDTTNATGGQAFTSDEHRVTEEVRIDGMACEILNLFNDIYCYRVAPFFNVLIDAYERPQILRYPVGGRYRAHADADVWNDEQHDWVRLLYRDYSVLLYINDEYEGGSLHFLAQQYTLRPNAGMLVAFPSDHHFMHEAQPTTAGIRYAVVSWGRVVASKPAKFPYRAVHIPLKQRSIKNRSGFP